VSGGSSSSGGGRRRRRRRRGLTDSPPPHYFYGTLTTSPPSLPPSLPPPSSLLPPPRVGSIPGALEVLQTAGFEVGSLGEEAFLYIPGVAPFIPPATKITYERLVGIILQSANDHYPVG